MGGGTERVISLFSSGPDNLSIIFLKVGGIVVLFGIQIKIDDPGGLIYPHLQV